MNLKIALVGDYNHEVTAHRAIPLALEMAGKLLDVTVRAVWLPTDSIGPNFDFAGFNGLWCVPASPYRNMDGALLAIQHARMSQLPFLGTCGGFQHAIIEYARNAMGWLDADHAETAQPGARLVVNPLVCQLVEAYAEVSPLCGTRLADIYQQRSIKEGYRCRFGMNPAIQSEFFKNDFRIAAVDEAGEVRAMEHRTHPFFIATLFQPERAALEGHTPLLVKAFLEASKRH
jgi:CTP synthase (UTP-ammonia lyase)